MGSVLINISIVTHGPVSESFVVLKALFVGLIKINTAADTSESHWFYQTVSTQLHRILCLPGNCQTNRPSRTLSLSSWVDTVPFHGKVFQRGQQKNSRKASLLRSILFYRKERY